MKIETTNGIINIDDPSACHLGFSGIFFHIYDKKNSKLIKNWETILMINTDYIKRITNNEGQEIYRGN